jgi:glycosyltransferase involved in cell wall biosynthesis
MNVLVITYWKFDDALIQTYTLPYLRIIRDILPEKSEIVLVTMEPEGEVKTYIPVEKNITRYSLRYHPFGIRAALAWNRNFTHLRNIVRKKKIDVVHSFCTPAGWPASTIARQMKLPLVLDSFEPHAEPMVETGTWSPNGMAFATLRGLEKKQVRIAKWVIGVVPGMQQYAATKYGFLPQNFLVKPACIDFTQFNLSRTNNTKLKAELGLENKVVCVYAGKFGGLYLREEAFRFFKAAQEEFGEAFRVLLLSSTPPQEIEQLCNATGLDTKIIVTRFVPHAEVPDYMGLADFAFSAFKPVPSRLYCTPIKNGEYWAMGLPVVIADGISVDSDIIRENCAGYVLADLSNEEFRNAAQYIKRLLETEDHDTLSERIHQLAQKHRNFAIAEQVYRTVYNNL